LVLEKKGNYFPEEKKDNEMITKLIMLSWNILGIKLSIMDVKQLFYEAKKMCSSQVGESEALLWTKDFKLLFDISRRDTDGLELHEGDLTAYILSLHEKEKNERLSLEHVEKLFPYTDSEYYALCRLEKGIPILLPLPSNQIMGWLTAKS